MTPAQSFLHVLAMLWSGEGLAEVFAWLPAGTRMTLVVWLPRLFRLALIALAVAFAYRLLLASPGRRSEHVRGTRLVRFRFAWLRRRLVFDRWKLRIGGVAFPKRLQPQHLLITGATGAGKSQTLHGMLDAIRGRGDRVIVTDIGAEALRGFGVGGDMLLNPLDARGASWSPFAELDSPADAERLAKSMIPDHQEGIEREWFIYSQALVAAVLKRLVERREATNGALLHALTLATPSELEALVSGLPAQALFHQGAEKMLASVRGIVGTYLAPYAYLPTEAGAKSWSIRRHVREGRGWLWLSYREDQAAALRPLLAAWIGEAVSAILSLAPDAKRRHWLLLDEVASLGRVQGLSDALTKGRKYGLCAMVGLQSVAHLTRGSRLAVLEGLAGTGKSHLLGAAREAWEASGYEARGAALAGKAAKGLAEGSGMRAQTLHSLLADLKSGRDRLNARTVLVIDEAGMVGSRQLARVLEEVDRTGAKLVLVGDANQLQPIEAGQLFERVGREVGTARLTEIRRQRDERERAMVQALARGDTRAALESLQERGRLHAAADRDAAMRELVANWRRGRDTERPGEDLMLGATRADARALNRLAREVLHGQGELKGERIIETANGPLALAQGDRIVITRNAKVLGMMNGDLATVTAIGERRGQIEVTALLDAGRTRTWRVSDHPHIEHGYALTAHKAQGASVERAYVLAHESLSAREWSYVAGSRAREAVHLYAERATAADLERIMGRSHKKDTALDYTPAAPAMTKAAVALER